MNGTGVWGGELEGVEWAPHEPVQCCECFLSELTCGTAHCSLFSRIGESLVMAAWQNPSTKPNLTFTQTKKKRAAARPQEAQKAMKVLDALGTTVLGLGIGSVKAGVRISRSRRSSCHVLRPECGRSSSTHTHIYIYTCVRKREDP